MSKPDDKPKTPATVVQWLQDHDDGKLQDKDLSNPQRLLQDDATNATN